MDTLRKFICIRLVGHLFINAICTRISNIGYYVNLCFFLHVQTYYRQQSFLENHIHQNVENVI